MTEFMTSSPTPTFTELILVRHGETSWNVEGKLQGHLDSELNELGRQQAAVLADRLSKESRISAIYSSDLKRAYETAQIIATGFSGLEVIKDQDLRERHLGNLQGLLICQAAKVHPKAYDALRSCDPCREIPGGGESSNQLYVRCTSALERIAKSHRGERVIIVTHGGVIRSLYKKACPNGSTAINIDQAPLNVVNTSINIIQISDQDKWSIKSWADIDHLSNTKYLDSGFGGSKASG